MDEQRHSNTLFIGGLPANATNENLETVFGEIGPLKRCFVVAGKGVGYVTFAFKEDAESAITTVKSFGGKKLNIKVANKKLNKKDAKRKTHEENTEGDVEQPPAQEKRVKYEIKQQRGPSKGQEGRLIIRNLPFKAEKDDIRKEFSRFGKVMEVSLPIKTDGKKLGFAFVQFQKYEEAVEAVKNLNAKPFMGRPIAVDHAVPQNEYLQIKNETHEESNNEDDVEDEPEPPPVIKDTVQKRNSPSVKQGTSDDVEDHDSTCDNNEWMESDGSDKDEELDTDDNLSENDVNQSDDEDEEEASTDEKRPRQKIKHRQSDVGEGKTLFIRNLNYSTTNQKLEEIFSQFGKLEYAKICVDRLTEHSKGTAFVKFKDKADAERCLQLVAESPKDGGIIVDEFKIIVNSAISKTDLNKQKQKEQLDKVKCNRNLYLAREGMIREGTKAAEGTSKQDLIKRTKVELWKRQMLQNLHIFVSKIRLCVRNLPPEVDNARLKRIFLKAAGPQAKITEARVMRYLGTTGDDGYGLSKGYGFVSFTQHESALKALRQVNNNPDIFTPSSRPIVEFSLENKSALRAKQKRLEKSTVKKSEKEAKTQKKSLDDGDMVDDFDDAGVAFAGVRSEEQRFKKGLPSHVGPKIRHGKISRNFIRKQKKLQRVSRKMRRAEKFRKSHVGNGEGTRRKGGNSMEKTESAKQRQTGKKKHR